MDYESDYRDYKLRVRVSDQSYVSYVDVTISVSPINEDPPTVIAGGVSTIREDTPIGTIIGGVEATDLDDKPHDIIFYQFAGKKLE